MRVLPLLLAFATLAATTLVPAPAAAACPPSHVDVAAGCVHACPVGCVFSVLRWSEYEHGCDYADVTCSNPPGWLTVVVAFVARGWVDPPQMTCSASETPLWVQNGVETCAVAVRVQSDAACVPIAFYVTGVGTLSGHTDSSWTGYC